MVLDLWLLAGQRAAFVLGEGARGRDVRARQSTGKSALLSIAVRDAEPGARCRSDAH
jgi:hypothetical protein